MNKRKEKMKKKREDDVEDEYEEGEAVEEEF